MPLNQWYRFDTANENPYSMIEDYAVCADGEVLEDSSRRGMRCTLKVGRKRMLDVARALGGILLFSERAKKLCEPLRVQKEIVWSPVEIIYKDKTKDSYWGIAGVTSRDKIDALDLDRSDIEWLVPSKKIIFKVNRWVLNGSRIPDVDLFFLAQVGIGWIVSGAFREAFEAEGLTGAIFSPCEVS